MLQHKLILTQAELNDLTAAVSRNIDDLIIEGLGYEPGHQKRLAAYKKVDRLLKIQAKHLLPYATKRKTKKT